MDKIATLLERLRPRIERLAGGGHDGEYLFAEVALACIEKHDRYDWSHPKIEGRIICIARKLWSTHLRRERLRKTVTLPREDCPALAREPSPASDTQPREVDGIRFQEAVDHLPDRYRQIIHEHFGKGRRLVAIAREMRLPSATIRTRCRRALQKLACNPTIQDLAASNGQKP